MFCFVFGYVISKMNANGKVLLNFFEAINDASVKMISLVML
jgi:Na+/H+-dicarboxylate symporter